MMQIEQRDPVATLSGEPSALEPLWLALFDHHVATGAAGMATREREGSWQQRRGHYLDTVNGSPKASLWIASAESGPVGYALSFVDSIDNVPVEVLETLSLLPETRGRGVGTELVARVEAAAKSRGLDRVAIDVMGGNHDAMRFYLRAGYAPHSVTWMRSARPAAETGVLGDIISAIATFAEIGAVLTATGHPDDTWVTAASVATLDLSGAVLPSDPAALASWWETFDRGVRELEETGHWTLWIEVADDGAGGVAGGVAGSFAEGAAARGFSHGMSRVTKSL